MIKKEFIKIDFAKERLKGSFRAMEFQDGNSFIIYIPSLKLSGYGDTSDEAYKLIKEILFDFSENLFALDSEFKVYNTLKELGWIRNRIFRKKMNNLSPTTFEDIKREFNIPDATPIKELSLAV